MLEHETGARVAPGSDSAGPGRIDVTEQGLYGVTGDVAICTAALVAVVLQALAALGPPSQSSTVPELAPAGSVER
jgi:hypothetical protein